MGTKMPWYMPQVPENIKKRACTYLLQRYLGQFFERKLSTDQLTIDLYNGTGTVKDITLDVQALNEVGEKQNWPMEFVDGYLEELFISVPWSSLLKDSSYIEVRNMKITVQPKQRSEGATSMFESMWSSMTNSMQLAEECMKQDADNLPETGQPLEGIERFAQTIDSILSRVKVKFINSLIQIEHVPKHSANGVAIQISIPVMNYSDEAGSDPPTGDDGPETDKGYVVSSFTTKNFSFEGITLSTVEFPSRARTISRSLISQTSSVGGEKEERAGAGAASSAVAGDDHVRVTTTDSCEFQSADSNSESETESGSGGAEERRHVIQFARLAGKQELIVRLKQSETLTGPKVHIQVNLGSLIVFLSPRQVHVLLELVNGLTSPDLEDNSNVPVRQKCTEKPLSGLDYQRIEHDLQQQLHPLSTFQSPGLQNIHGWSTAALEESDTDENFLPMRNANEAMMCDSTLSGASSSMETSVSSSMISSATDNTRQRRQPAIDSDPMAEISHFKIQVSSLACVLLHEDILTLSAECEQSLLASSVRQMRTVAATFFDDLGLFAVSGYGNKDFDNARNAFEKACNLNHLRLLAAPLHIEGDETTTPSIFSISGKLTVAKMELLECLQHKTDKFEYIPLLHFHKHTNSASIFSQPNFKLSFKHVEKTSKAVLRPPYTPKTDVGIHLDTCTIEIDISLIDRINALLNPQPVCAAATPTTHTWTAPSHAPSTHHGATTQFHLKIVAPSVNVKFRFPVPDFRPAHDMQRNPWWKRHVRPDWLLLQLTDATAATSWTQWQRVHAYSLRCHTVDVSYVEGAASVPLPIGRARSGGCARNDVGPLTGGMEVPMVVLEIHPDRGVDLDVDAGESDVDPMTQSTYGTVGSERRMDAGPFSAKRVVHESDTPHAKAQKENTEELIIPGDKQEIDDFIATASQNAKIRLQITLPIVSVQLVSKHIYEVLYNRINSDLLLWEPSAPKFVPQSFETIFNRLSEPTNAEVHEMFTMCRSGIQYDSGSGSGGDDDTEETTTSGVYYSVCENRARHTQQRKVSRVKVVGGGQSAFALTLHIGTGLACMHVPVRDPSTNVLPGQHGELVFNVEAATIFTVAGYKGDANRGFVCVQAHNVQLHHCEMTATPSQPPPLREADSALPTRLMPTIYQSESGVQMALNERRETREMFSVAVGIQASHETHHVKTIRVALGMNRATLQHRMHHESNSWISQLIDFFNVVVYPISGYNAKDVLTELHLHLWDCAIDYRPLYLPLRSLVTVGNFTMSSHLSSQANTSTLRFIAEDGELFLSDKSPPKGGVPSTAAVHLKNDYVSVMEIGLFELSLRTNDRKCGVNPHFDLRASNNIVHVRTCADSGRALMQLLIYFAGDGDLQAHSDTPTSGATTSNVSTPKHQHPDHEELVAVEPQNFSNLSQSQHQHVNDLLGEAMRESISVDESACATTGGAKLFFFPDEGAAAHDAAKPLAQVTQELGDVTRPHAQKSSDTDEEFCFIGDETGLGLIPREGVADIRWLSEEPVRVLENHFAVPVDRADVLRPPKHFPTPVVRYALREMSLVWHMYGGHDFECEGDEEPPAAEQIRTRKTVNFADVRLRDAVSFTNSRSGEVVFTSCVERPRVSWQVKGGAGRDHKVLMELQLNKVKFQHEVYPEHTTQASRQVLLINEVEIRDRLESSQINKFLYQYVSQSRPKQLHAHMVVVKAIHLRPDVKLKTKECCLKVSILPLRLNIDQDSLLFLIQFFNELSGASEAIGETSAGQSKHTTPTHQPPIMTVTVESEKAVDEEEVQKIVDENLLILLEENNVERKQSDKMDVETTNNDESPPTYFKTVLFSPEVLIRLDYQGKRVDMKHGPLAGLLMGLGQLNCSEIRLKKLVYRHGLLGVDKLFSYCLHEWLNDIKKNQLPSLLGGVGPMHSLVQLFQGIKDLFWLPIEQYQKDGRIVRGIQRGANSFTTCTAMAALELTSRIIHLIQITAETAYDMVSPGPSVRRMRRTKGKRKRYNQPQDIREGMANAYMLVKEGIGETADNLVRVASHEHEQKGYSGAVGGVIRQIPPTFVKPIIIATEATNNVLEGMQSQLVPDARREATQKWRNDSDM